MAHPHVSSGGRYPVLRAVAILFMINALVSIGVGIYWIVQEMSLPHDTMTNRIQVSAAIAAATFFAAILMIGFAEMIKLFIDIEYNCRVAGMAAGKDAINPATGKRWLDGEETAEGALLRGH